MSNVTIRKFQPGDETTLSPMIRRVLVEVNTEDPKWENDWLYEHYTPENILEASTVEDASCYVLEKDGEIVGTGSIRVDKEKSEKHQNRHAEIYACFIHADHIGEGLGGILFNALEKDEIFLQAHRVWLTTSVMARGFYEHLGYSYTYGYLGKDEDNLVQMHKLPVVKD